MKKKVTIDRDFTKTFNNLFGSTKTVRLTLRGVPAVVEVDDNGNWLSAPLIENESAIMGELVDPFANGLSGINKQHENVKYIAEFSGKTSQPNKDLNKQDTTQVNADDKSEGDKGSSTVDYFVETPGYGLSRVVLPQTTMNDIEITLNLIKQHSLMYDKWNLKSVYGSGSHSITINLYGPSGTGKTLCAEAIAFELNKGILRVKYPQLESSLVGQTNKNMQQVFKTGREKDCVIFFDEADSILGKRLSSVIQSADHAVNMSRSVMLIELEKFNGVIIFATNFIQNYDPAFARRLLHFVKFDLPDLESRAKIFKIHLPEELPVDWEDLSLEKLAELADGFNGGDIKNVVMKSAAKAASQNLPDDKKIVRASYFIESINEIRQTKNLISPY
jgi:SpoVK/Ycf46/Vps4 family AAA+-type ATPase